MDKELLLLTPNQTTVLSLQKIAKICCIFVILIGFLSFLTWLLRIPVTTDFFPNVIGMNPVVAVGFISAAGALWLQFPNGLDKTKWRSRVALLLSSFTLLLGSTTTIYLILEHVLFTTKGISLDMGLSFIFVSIALILQPIPTGKKFMRIAQGFSLIVGLLSMFALLGYLYRSLSLYAIFPTSPMPLSSAVTFSILSIALLFARPGRGFTKVLTRSTPSSILAFRLILLTLTFPAVLGFLIFQGEELHLYDAQTGITLLVIGSICILSIAVWINSSVLQKLELENLIIKNELEKRNISLEIDEKSKAAKILELEEEKKEAYDKLDYREKMFDLPANSQ